MSRSRTPFIGGLLVAFAFGCGEAPTAPPLPAFDIAAQSYDCATQTDLLDGCGALVSLFDGMGGTTWFNNTGWLQTTHPCSWYGVTCQPDFDPSSSLSLPAGVSLPNNNLRGPITLAFLRDIGSTWEVELDLSGNSIFGDLIAVDEWTVSPILHGSSFSSIDLSSNQLTGPVPHSFVQMSDLGILDLSDNDFVGVLHQAYGPDGPPHFEGPGTGGGTGCDFTGNHNLSIPLFYDLDNDGLYCSLPVVGIDPVAASTTALVDYYVSIKLLRRADGNKLDKLIRTALRERSKGEYASAIAAIQSYLDQIGSWVPGKLTPGQQGHLTSAGIALVRLLQDEAGA